MIFCEHFFAYLYRNTKIIQKERRKTARVHTRVGVRGAQDGDGRVHGGVVKDGDAQVPSSEVWRVVVGVLHQQKYVHMAGAAATVCGLHH